MSYLFGIQKFFVVSQQLFNKCEVQLFFFTTILGFNIEVSSWQEH